MKNGKPAVKNGAPKRRPAKATKKVYTMADKPPGMHPELWRMRIEQGKVETATGAKLLEFIDRYGGIFDDENEARQFRVWLKKFRRGVA